MSYAKAAWAVVTTMACGLALASAKSAPGKGVTAARGYVKRGEYLVTIGGCNDCHTPWKMGKQGPEPDFSRRLSGHPEQLAMSPDASAPGGNWQILASGTFTAWSGPWGVSFTANLTPDEETGIGRWSEQQFIDAIRSGRHEGRGRPILPPMPWQNYGQMTDTDLKAVFAYLRTIEPIRNRVPDPIPPRAQAGEAGVTPTSPPTGTGSAGAAPSGETPSGSTGAGAR